MVLQFLDESSYFKGSKFMLNGHDLLIHIRIELRDMKRDDIFGSKIPDMDKYGRLTFDAQDEEKTTEKKSDSTIRDLE